MYMFYGCSNLETIYISSIWNISNVDDNAGNGMFQGCNKLIGGAGTYYNGSYLDKTYARIDNPPDSPGYLTYKSYTGN